MHNFIFRVNLYLSGTSVHNFIVSVHNFILDGHPGVHQE